MPSAIPFLQEGRCLEDFGTVLLASSLCICDGNIDGVCLCVCVRLCCVCDCDGNGNGRSLHGAYACNVFGAADLSQLYKTRIATPPPPLGGNAILWVSALVAIPSRRGGN